MSTDSDLTAHGPYNNDIYLPQATLLFLPAGGFVGGDLPGYTYISLVDAAGVERALAAYFVGPDGHGYRVRQAVMYGPGDPLDPETERIPDTLDSEVTDLGNLNTRQLTTIINTNHPRLSPGQ